MTRDCHKADFYCLAHLGASGITRAIVIPSWGANIVAYSFQEHGWTCPISVLEKVDMFALTLKPTSYGVPILAPTPGRVGRNQSGLFEYEGVEYRVSPSRHGFLRDVPWEVSRYSAEELTCETSFSDKNHREPHMSFPYDFCATYEIRVLDQSLDLKLVLLNTGECVQPLNAGWHPYLQRSSHCRVCIPASERWELDGNPEPVPTGRILDVSGNDDFRRGRWLSADEHWDDIFTGLKGEQGSVSCWVEEDTMVRVGHKRSAPVRVRRSVNFVYEDANAFRGIPNVQLYTPPGREAISIEPISSPPNAINLLSTGHEKAHVCEVAPGENVTFGITISLAVSPLMKPWDTNSGQKSV